MDKLSLSAATDVLYFFPSLKKKMYLLPLI